MSLTDQIADMLTRVRNANMVTQETVQCPYSKVKDEIARVMKQEGYIKDKVTENVENKKTLTLYLKYKADKTPIIRGLRRISSGGCRVYVGAEEVPRVLNGIGTAVLTTSKGVMTDRDARQAGVGGEVVCHIW